MGRGPASRFGLIPTSLSPPRHAPPRRLSPSSFSREFLRLNPRLVVVVHSRGVVWRSKLVDHGVRIHSDTKSNLARLQYPHPLEPLLLPNPNQLSLHPRPLPHVPSTLPRSFDASRSSAATWITRRQFAERGLRRRWMRTGIARGK